MDDVARVVIVGGGQGAAQTAMSLRDLGFPGSVDVVSAEARLPYQRPPLSKGYLLGKVDADELALRPRGHYDDIDVRLHLGATASDIDRNSQILHVGNGFQLPYDRLVIATGARPRRIRIPGSDLPGVVYLSEVTESQALLDTIGAGKTRVVVIGGGFIGLEVAATAVTLGNTVTLLETADSLMARIASPSVSDFFKRLHETQGTEILLGTSAVEIIGDQHVQAVRTLGGRVIDCDVVVVGIGAVPNTELAERSGLDVHDGVRVDGRLTTSDNHVLAIGDCAAFPCAQASGAVLRLESVQNAADQGRHVAAVIMGDHSDYTALPWFWSDQAGVKYQIAGLPRESHEQVILGDQASGKFSVLHFANENLTHVESVGSAGEHMLARRVLAGRHYVGPQDARASGFSLKKFLMSVV